MIARPSKPGHLPGCAARKRSSSSSCWGAPVEVATSNVRSPSNTACSEPNGGAGSRFSETDCPWGSRPVTVRRPCSAVNGSGASALFQPPDEIRTADSGAAMTSRSGLTSASSGTALANCRPTMICAARTVSAKASSVIPIAIRGIAACGSDWNPCGSGGFTSLVWTVESLSSWSRIGR